MEVEVDKIRYYRIYFGKFPDKDTDWIEIWEEKDFEDDSPIESIYDDEERGELTIIKARSKWKLFYNPEYPYNCENYLLRLIEPDIYKSKNSKLVYLRNTKK